MKRQWVTIRELKLFRGDYIAFRDIDKDFLNSFVDFLKQVKKASKFGLLKAGGVLSNNSVIAYYGVLRTAINRAYKEGIITVNPTKEFDFANKVKSEVSRREYLTIENIGNNVLFLFPSNINEMFYIFRIESYSVLLLCRGFFLLYIWGSHHKRHHKQEYDRYMISFGQSLCHPKIGERKQIGFAFLFFLYCITSFFKEWTGG